MANEIDFSSLDELLGKVNLDDVTAEKGGNTYEDLPEGYYLVEVNKAELTNSKKGDPMVKLTLKVVEDGLAVVANAKGDATFQDIPKSKGRMIFKYYVLKDTKAVMGYVSDMLKFEGEEEGVPLLDKELFLSSVTMSDALEILEGTNIYAQITYSTKKDTDEKSSWTNLISWARAKKLELPM